MRDLSPSIKMQTMSEKTHRKVWTSSAPEASQSSPKQSSWAGKTSPRPCQLQPCLQQWSWKKQREKVKGNIQLAARFWVGVAKDKHTQITRKFHSASDLVDWMAEDTTCTPLKGSFIKAKATHDCQQCACPPSITKANTVFSSWLYLTLMMGLSGSL